MTKLRHAMTVSFFREQRERQLMLFEAAAHFDVVSRQFCGALLRKSYGSYRNDEQLVCLLRKTAKPRSRNNVRNYAKYEHENEKLLLAPAISTSISLNKSTMCSAEKIRHEEPAEEMRQKWVTM
jgi:hypothetical protein